MPTFVPLADAELFIRTFLAAQFPTTRVVTETPANLGDVLPCLQVTRFGGSDSDYVLDAANIDIDAYAATRGAAYDLAGQARSAILLHLRGYIANGAAATSATTLSAPRWVPYDNTSLRRVTAAYRITIHSIPS